MSSTSDNQKRNELQNYSKESFPGSSNQNKYCSKGKFGKSQPVLIIKTQSSQIYLVYYTSDSINHYEISQRQNNKYQNPKILLDLKKEICKGPQELIPLKCSIEFVKKIDFKLCKLGNFLQINESFILVTEEKPLSLVLIKEKFEEILADEELLDIVDNITRYKFKKVDIKYYEKFEDMNIIKFPFLFKNIDLMLQEVRKYFDNKKGQLVDYVKNSFDSTIKIIENRDKYYTGPEKVKRYLITISEKNTAETADNKYLIHFTFKSISTYQSFEVDQVATKERSEEVCKSIENELAENEFQNRFHDRIAMIHEYNTSTIGSIKFRIGDCLLIKYDNTLFHHGIYVGCEENCKNSGQCRMCKNIFYIANSRSEIPFDIIIIKQNCKYMCITIDNFIKKTDKLIIKRNQFSFYTKQDYQNKLIEINAENSSHGRNREMFMERGSERNDPAIIQRNYNNCVIYCGEEDNRYRGQFENRFRNSPIIRESYDEITRENTFMQRPDKSGLGTGSKLLMGGAAFAGACYLGKSLYDYCTSNNYTSESEPFETNVPNNYTSSFGTSESRTQANTYNGSEFTNTASSFNISHLNFEINPGSYNFPNQDFHRNIVSNTVEKINNYMGEK